MAGRDRHRKIFRPHVIVARSRGVGEPKKDFFLGHLQPPFKRYVTLTSSQSDRCPVRCRHEQAEYLEELDGAKVEDLTGKAKVGPGALAPQPKLDIILGGVVLLSGQQREVKIESWLVDEKVSTEESNEDEELNVCEGELTGVEGGVGDEDEEVSHSNRFKKDLMTPCTYCTVLVPTNFAEPTDCYYEINVTLVMPEVEGVSRTETER
eukprot:scaffold2117_cov82-Skeletonema_dohrnii-CCMP3373.AAC.1